MGEQGDHFGGEPRRNVRGRAALVRQVMRGCLPGELAIELPGLGELILRPVVSESDAVWLWQSRRSCEVVPLECAGGEAHLLIERGFAMHSVNAMLGCAPVCAAGSLSRIERGLLHGILAVLSARLGLPLTVGVCSEERQAPGPDSVVVEFSVGLRGGAGRAWLCAPEEFMAQILAASERLTCLELGRTRVPLSQLAEAKAGDVVVFDETAALPAADPWPICIRGRGAVVAASLRPDGILADVDADDLGIVTRADRRPARIPAQSDAAKPPPASTEPAAEISAELGRFHGPLLARLLCGAPLDGGRDRPILLRLADAPWAEGEIVAFDVALAARITRKLAD
jgi:hypothetical protein